MPKPTTMCKRFKKYKRGGTNHKKRDTKRRTTEKRYKKKDEKTEYKYYY